jgi:hypothetical protein
MKPIYLFAFAAISLFSSCANDYDIKELSVEEAKTYADPTLSSYFVADNTTSNLVVTVQTDDAGKTNYIICKESNGDLIDCKSYSPTDSTGTNCPPDCGVAIYTNGASDLINQPKIFTEEQRKALKENIRKGEKGISSFVIPKAVLEKFKKEPNSRLIKVYVGSVKNKKILIGYGLDSTGNRLMGSRIYSWKFEEGKSKV